MATAQIINCLVCMEPVRPRQQGVQCDGCFHWSHSRTAGKSQLPLYLLISLLHREPVWLHFKSGSFQRGSYGAFSRISSGTSRRRSSPYGMSLTLETAVQESSWRRARTLTAQQLPKSTLHSVDSLLWLEHCITFDIARLIQSKNNSFRNHWPHL